jgi:Tfp pilus assembly protein PilO
VIAGIAILAIVLVVVWYTALWAPQAGKLATATATQSKAETQQLQLQTRLVALEVLKLKLPLLLAERRRLEAAVPSGSQLARGLSGIDKAATESGVVVSSLTPSAAVNTATGAAATLAQLDVSISANGSYAQAMNFIYLLDMMPRLYVLSTVSLTPGQGDQVTEQLDGDLFYQAPPVGGSGA